jgi:hypothetical protein
MNFFSFCKKPKVPDYSDVILDVNPEANEIVHSQGFTDVFKILDSEKINKIISLLDVVDVHKIQKLMNSLHVDANGDVKLSVELNLKGN